MWLLLLTALLAGAYELLSPQLDIELASWRVYLVLSVFAIITYISHEMMSRSDKERPAQFANRFMASQVIKLLGGLLVFLIVALTSPKAEVLPFGVVFILVYLVYTVFGSYHATKLKDGGAS